jgi:hypothetical protein
VAKALAILHSSACEKTIIYVIEPILAYADKMSTAITTACNIMVI